MLRRINVPNITENMKRTKKYFLFLSSRLYAVQFVCNILSTSPKDTQRQRYDRLCSALLTRRLFLKRIYLSPPHLSASAPSLPRTVRMFPFLPKYRPHSKKRGLIKLSWKVSSTSQKRSTISSMVIKAEKIYCGLNFFLSARQNCRRLIFCCCFC